jgi:hypothetical protein
MAIHLRPVTLAEARRFVGTHHRHNLPPVGWKWGVGVSDDAGELVGVAIASRPVARHADDGRTIEVTRTCTTGEKNANSMLYGAICRAAGALGYEKVITYTLADEPGGSLRGAGFVVDAEVSPPPNGWESRPGREHADLFGNERKPSGPQDPLDATCGRGGVMAWLWHKWHSAIRCAFGFHRSCDGWAYDRHVPCRHLCACRCHVKPGEA